MFWSDTKSMKRIPITETPTREDWIRMAAFIDGEGHISIRNLNRGSKTKKNMNYVASVAIYNTDPRLMQWMKSVFGGSVAMVQSSSKKTAAKHYLHYWRVTTLRAEWILKNSLEFFIIKKHQAEIALAFRGTFSRPDEKNKVTPEVMSKRENFMLQLKSSRHEYAIPVPQEMSIN